jgi:hypothetical protein
MMRALASPSERSDAELPAESGRRGSAESPILDVAE